MALFRIQLFTILSVIAMGATWHAQAESRSAVAVSTSVNRRVELLIRSQFSVPSGYEIVIGEKTPSTVSGFDSIPVTFIHAGSQTTTVFLISKDCNTLARLETFDMSKDPALAINVDARPIRGDATAKVEIVNFDDLECPYCAQLNNELSKETLDHYRGLVKIIYKDFPIEEIHPWAMHAAVDANCLGDLSAEAYWAYIDYVHAHGQDISGPRLEPGKSFLALDHIANTFGTAHRVDEPKLAMCLKKQDETVIRSSLKLGASLQINATPQVFVDGERLISGARPVGELWPAIDRALKAKGIQPPR
jgi:protein-disulfide isomerase